MLVCLRVLWEEPFRIMMIGAMIASDMQHVVKLVEPQLNCGGAVDQPAAA